jgi:hypothetical protein
MALARFDDLYRDVVGLLEDPSDDPSGPVESSQRSVRGM